MKRRDFIVKSSLVSSGIVASTGAMHAMTNNFDFSEKSIRLGVIGTGDRGGGLIPIINEIKGMDVVACCDVLPFRLENGLSRTKKKAKGYNDHRQLLDDSSIDAVLIATTFSEHERVALDAIDAGKHVYCEKTMAKGLKGIDSLVAKVKTSDKIFQTGHQYHSSRLYAHVVDLIHKGEIGELTSFECQWNRNGNWRRAVPDPSLERAINWRMYREYSGGMAAELCSHQIDFIQWVLGENPNKIMGVGGIDYWKDGRETYDNIHLLFEYPGGIKAQFTCLTSNSLGDYQIKVHGSKGTILLDYTKAWIYYEPGIERELTEVDGVSGATANTHLQGSGIPLEISHLDPSMQALIDFRDNVQQGTAPLSDVNTGADTARAVQLSLDAMYTGSIQKWDATVDH